MLCGCAGSRTRPRRLIIVHRHHLIPVESHVPDSDGAWLTSDHGIRRAAARPPRLGP